MTSRIRHGAALSFVCWAALAMAAGDPVPFNDGDRVVFVGPTFIEREGRYGCIETLMTAHFRDRELTFRNLGWSGDTVFGDARAGFDTAKEGYERLIKQVADAEPDVILVSYGQNESFEGEAGLEHFVTGLNKLLDDLAETNARIVLISPTLQENLGAPLPDPAAHNADIRLYTAAMRDAAAARSYPFVDMTQLLPVAETVSNRPRTDNGLHFTEAGYWEAAAALLRGLGYDVGTPDPAALAELRDVVIEKNRLFFNTWRAQNDTYIFGFRKHEQGGYAEEIPQFLPLVAEQEKVIADLRVDLAKNNEVEGTDAP